MDSEFCFNCGFKFKINAKFCAKCGEKREKIEPEEKKEFDGTVGSHVCPNCNIGLEFKGKNLFTKCRKCEQLYHLPGDEWNKFEKKLKRKVLGHVVGSVMGIVFGLMIALGGIVMLIGFMELPVFIAGQYLIIAMIVIIGGAVIMALSYRRMTGKKLEEKRVEWLNEYEIEYGYSGDYLKLNK
jgi:hypothetical protein